MKAAARKVGGQPLKRGGLCIVGNSDCRTIGLSDLAPSILSTCEVVQFAVLGGFALQWRTFGQSDKRTTQGSERVGCRGVGGMGGGESRGL